MKTILLDLCVFVRGMVMPRVSSQGSGQVRRARWVPAGAVLGVAALMLFLASGQRAEAQLDQGTVTGVVQDTTGAVISGATVTLTETDTGLKLTRTTGRNGIYTFSPVKIGNYDVSADAPGFQTVVQEHLELVMQQQLKVVLTLHPGQVSDTVTISAEPPALQTESSAVGQTFSTQSINDTPLNGRNWVYMAQLSAGVVGTPGSRGGGTGDFSANGQRPDQNNFVLDGVDNNVNIADFQGGASYSVRPPPDALAEFQVQTTNYSAEFGHSVGAALSASIKSGTNHVHGDVWEYFRNTNLEAQDWNALSKPPYHQNQFGGTLGFPFLKNKLFSFSDVEANRITFAQTFTGSVPTALERQGNFTELLNTALTGSAKPIQLYTPNSGGKTTQSCNGLNNVLCQNQISTAAQTLLNLFPLPNAGPQLTNNYVTNLPYGINTVQWDERLDYNPTARDQAFFRYSYQHIQQKNSPPFGLPLDGTTTYAGVSQNFLTESGVFSETHVFSPSVVNEFRVGYNWGTFQNLQGNLNNNLSSQFGLGGIPFGPGYPDNGGLPSFSVTGISTFGSHGFDPSIKGQNIYQILDNATFAHGKNTLKVGVDFQSIRSSALSPPMSRGTYTFSGRFTSNPALTNTSGYGVADFLTDQVFTAGIGNETQQNFSRWYRAGYAQDDYKLTERFTINLGVRYDYYQSPKDTAGHIANLLVNSIGVASGTGVFQLPASTQTSNPLSANFLALLAKNNVTVQYVNGNPSLLNSPKYDFAPRVGFAYTIDPRTVIRGGFGIFYGGLEAFGGDNIGQNYPFFLSATFPTTGTCAAATGCPSDGLTLETGFTQAITTGLYTFISAPTFSLTDQNIHIPNTMGYNVSGEHAFTNTMTATLSYVGNVAHRLPTNFNRNAAAGLQVSGASNTNALPFTGFGNSTYVTYEGQSMYNSLQARLEKRYSKGLQFLATYTWSHAMDDSSDPLNGGVSPRAPNIVPLIEEYTNSPQDVRNRFTLNGNYQLPYGLGRSFGNRRGVLNEVAGGWSVSATFVAQSGQPFTVSPNNTAAVGPAQRNANLARDPYSVGGPSDASLNGTVCATSTRNRTNWYNPCAFTNPLPGSAIAKGVFLTTPDAALPYLGGRSEQLDGPGYNRLNMSLFKNFTTFREQYLQFRADAFNVANHPSFANPNIQTDNSNGGQITGPKSLQANSPDARFFQLAAKYVF
jgi:hypothetical protein